MSSWWRTRRRSCACCALVTGGGVATGLERFVSHQHRSHGYHNQFRRATVDNSCPACNKTFESGAEALDHIACRARWCRQSDKKKALADERGRKEAVKLGGQGWAQLRGLRGKRSLARGLRSWVALRSVAEGTGDETVKSPRARDARALVPQREQQ